MKNRMKQFVIWADKILVFAFPLKGLVAVLLTLVSLGITWVFCRAWFPPFTLGCLSVASLFWLGSLAFQNLGLGLCREEFGFLRNKKVFLDGTTTAKSLFRCGAMSVRRWVELAGRHRPNSSFRG